jgi:hypothetical protein
MVKGPIHKIIVGGGGEFYPYAVSKLIELEAQLQDGQSATRVYRVGPDAGVTIMVETNPMRRAVTIYKTCPKYISGLVYRGFIASVKPPDPDDPPEIVAMDDPEGVYKYAPVDTGADYAQGFYPSAAQAARDNTTRAF